MAHRIEIRQPLTSDIEALMSDLRPADYDEVTAATGPDIKAEINRAVSISTFAYTAVVNDKVAALFGCGPYAALAGMGSPWLLGTTVLDRLPKSICKYSKAMLEATKDTYPHLINYVDARHARSIQWLKWLGFTIHEAAPFGYAGFPFHKFELIRPRLSGR